MSTETLLEQCCRIALHEAIEVISPSFSILYLDTIQAPHKQKVGVATLAASSSAIYAANTFLPKFRTSLGVSGKVALAISPAVGAYFLTSELTLFDAKRNPANYGIHVDGASSPSSGGLPPPSAQVVSKLSAHHRVANWVYYNPFKV